MIRKFNAGIVTFITFLYFTVEAVLEAAAGALVADWLPLRWRWSTDAPPEAPC